MASYKILHAFWIVPLCLLFLLFLLRLVNSRQIDDIHPDIPCEQEYIDKSKILWVVPKFEGHSINESQEWCRDILALNKTLGLHGITHTYQEFYRNNFTEKELQEAKEIFEGCFGFEPEMFKPPQLAINKGNRILIRENFKLYWMFNQVIHKVYHCDDNAGDNKFGGFFSNRFHDLV